MQKDITERYEIDHKLTRRASGVNFEITVFVLSSKWHLSA